MSGLKIVWTRRTGVVFVVVVGGGGAAADAFLPTRRGRLCLFRTRLTGVVGGVVVGSVLPTHLHADVVGGVTGACRTRLNADRLFLLGPRILFAAIPTCELNRTFEYEFAGA